MTSKHMLPTFKSINPANIVESVVALTQKNSEALAHQLKTIGEPTWENLVLPIEEREDALNKFWSPIGHLNSVCSSAELRVAHDSAIQILSDYYTAFGQNEALFDAYKMFSESTSYNALSDAQKTIIEHSLRDFRLSGIDLDQNKKQRFKEIKSRLSVLTSTFSNHVLDATEAWNYQTDNLDELRGLPQSVINGAKEVAELKKLSGYCLKLDGPVYIAVMTYAENASLRETFYEAYCTRASDVGPNTGKWDNAPLIDEILALRKEIALLLGMKHYAERSLATKMADNVQEVESFLRELAEKAKPSAEKDYAELKKYAADTYGAAKLEPWDVAFYSEKLKTDHYDVSQEELRQYFTLPKVLDGLFSVAESLFSVEVKRAAAPDLWHEDACYYEVYKNNILVAGFYTDLYVRDGKRGGAWMDVCLTRREYGGNLQLPVAYLVCNFNRPNANKPCLLTHNEVTTLFHEFGHGLHHMMTQMQHASISGIAGVEWDAVELPSQFLENWAWQPRVLKFISEHVDTKESLPDTLIDKMLAAKNFQSGMFLLRQIEFGLFDILIHRDFGTKDFSGVQDTINSVRNDVALVIPPEYNRFQNGFSHIFAGGYAAGYYSYLWAEVLSSDAFSAFEENGIFDKTTGQRFLDEILSQGGSKPAAVLFKNFRGREPRVEALLKQCGIQ